MGDMGDVFRAMNEARKERRFIRLHKNIGIIQESFFNGDIHYKESNNHTVFVFREPGKPKVDFYPGTGRWKVKNKMYKGGAESFLKWYSKQSKQITKEKRCQN